MFISVKVLPNKMRIIFLGIFFSLLNGCMVGPDFVKPSAQPNFVYGHESIIGKALTAQGVTQTLSIGLITDSKWWNMFESESLDQIVELALKQNPSVHAFEATLRQSQNQLRAGYGVFFPSISLGFSASRNALSPIQLGYLAPESIFSLLTASASISYTLDAFGGFRRQIESLQAQVRYQQYVTAAAYLMLSANVVNASIARAAYMEEIAITEELLSLEKEQLAVAKAQFQGGTASYASVLSIESVIASNQASLVSLRQRLSQVEHLLAVLEGVDPVSVALPRINLSSLSLPSNIPISLPSDLVKNRPDILAAEEQMHIASANIGVATANMFPSISLNAGYGLASNKFTNLSEPIQEFWSTGFSAQVPILKGGSLYYARQAALDEYEKSQLNYKQAVLSAFAQVADCLTAIEHDAEFVERQHDAKLSAANSLQLQQINYKAGLIDYIGVLIADMQYRKASMVYTQALAQRFQNTVALYVALGGGWNVDPLQ